MKLRRLVLTGFKTFARRSELSLEPGITAIVGPNGSGKSNLVDAIRWALGETNARELRGARMDEVIYAGGGGRGRMGLAEVELVFDNEDGGLPVADVEVAISRRVARGGDSEYRVNGDRVRLRDLERLLTSTGLTQSGYAVVAQTDIDAIIEASPLQRRALVEQAAGVRSLRAAVDDVLGRVERAEITLQRFEDLLGDAEPRLAELAEQAAVALEQRQLTDRLAGLRGSLAREAWRSARARQRLARRRLEVAAGRFEAAAEAEAAFARQLAGHRARLERLRDGQRIALGRLEEERLRGERARGRSRRGADRLRHGVLQRAAAAAEVAAAEAEAAAVGSALREIERERESGGSTAVAGAALAAARADAEAQEAALRAAEGALHRAEHLVSEAEEQRLSAEAARGRHGTQLRLLTEAAAVLEQRAAESRVRLGERRAQARAAASAREASLAAVGAAREARDRAQTALEGARSAAAAAQRRLDGARAAARQALARAAGLRGQVDGALGGTGAIAATVAAGELEAARLVDLVRVADPADAAAIEALLEVHLGAWVVTDVDAASAHLVGDAAREELLSWMPDRMPQAATPPAGTRRALDALGPAARGRELLAVFLTDGWLAPDLETARRAVACAGGAAALPDGTVVLVAGLRGGGRPGRTLELADREQAAAAAADAAVAAERVAANRASGASTEVAAAERAEQAAAEAVRVAMVDDAERAALASGAEHAAADEAQRLETLEVELADGAQAHLRLAGEAARTAADLDRAGDALASARAAAAEARAAVTAAGSRAAECREAVRSAERHVADLRAQSEERDRRLQSMRSAGAAASRRLEAAVDRVLAGELDVLAAVAEVAAAGLEEDAAGAAIAVAGAALDEVAPGLQECERAVLALEGERSEVAVVLARAADEREAAEREAGAAAAEVAELAEAVRDDDEDEGPEPDAGDAERAEREIIRLERRIAGLGAVNALAPEQHQRLAARVVVLRAGRDDLGSACADIRAMAAGLTAAVDQRFEAVLGAVSVHFHELFAELFPGGRATLRAEPGEPAAGRPEAPGGAGIEILAQPPGKRLQPLSLFSGGERALTAIAVILALQQVNPSPFYVFDEVDAPLDDSNVLRFTRLLRRLASTQQFILVTHNHVTMAAADALHGVTSDEEGISSVIGVRFDPGAGEPLHEGHVVGLRSSTVRAAV